MQTAKSITPKQIKKIHAIKNRLGWSDDEYREYLMTEGDGFATSCKDLNEAEAERLIRKMELMAAAKGVWEIRDSKRQCQSVRGSECQSVRGAKKYEDLGDREGMASPKQLRMIEAMWKEVSRAKTDTERVKTIRTFIYKRWGVSDIRWLERWQVKKVVEAIKKMKMMKQYVRREYEKQID